MIRLVYLNTLTHSFFLYIFRLVRRCLGRRPPVFTDTCADFNYERPERGSIAIVTPWYGADLVGGAETQSRELAFAFQESGLSVDVLATCSKGPLENWSINHHHPGVRRCHGVKVKRFCVSSRDDDALCLLNILLLGAQKTITSTSSGLPSLANDVFAKNSIRSSSLTDYLRENSAHYRLCIFIPYLYGVILDGIAVTKGNAVLQPCLHDEPYVQLPCIQAAFHHADSIALNSKGELRLAQGLLPAHLVQKCTVVGQGIIFQKRYNSLPGGLTPDGYILYAGKKTNEKGIAYLLDAFNKSLSKAGNLQLVLIGPGDRVVAPNVIDLGLVSTHDKEVLISSCRALVVPGKNESYSRSMMEAWLAGRPVVVNSECSATADTVSEFGGGLVFEEHSLNEALCDIWEMPQAERDAVGDAGRAFAVAKADWRQYVDKYLGLAG